MMDDDQVKVYLGEGWNLDFHRTHFDLYSPPDFYVKVNHNFEPVIKNAS